MVTNEQIKNLREQTGVSVMQCKKALLESHGDIALAIDFLRKKGEEGWHIPRTNAYARNQRGRCEGCGALPTQRWTRR